MWNGSTPTSRVLYSRRAADCIVGFGEPSLSTTDFSALWYMARLAHKCMQAKQEIVTYVLINYEILDDDSILNGCPSINKYIYSVIGSRLLPENPLTTLKKKEVGKV